jgi:hypothetical protein
MLNDTSLCRICAKNNKQAEVREIIKLKNVVVISCCYGYSEPDHYCRQYEDYLCSGRRIDRGNLLCKQCLRFRIDTGKRMGDDGCSFETEAVKGVSPVE